MVMELIKDNRKIVDRITHNDIDKFVELLTRKKVSVCCCQCLQTPNCFGRLLEKSHKMFYFSTCIVTKVRPKKVNYMFLRHHPRHFQPPRIKNFIAFAVFTLKNRLYIANCLSRSAVICCHFVC